MSDAVLADAQFGKENVLRPYEGFEDQYQGQLVNRPVMFTKPATLQGAWGVALDPKAGQVGYHASLLNALKVPYGARVIIKLPILSWTEGGLTYGYRWILRWRSRNLYDFRQDRTPWHFPSQASQIARGVVTGGGVGVALVPIPACNQSIVYSQPETAGPGYEQVQHLLSEEVIELTPVTPTIGTAINPNAAAGIIEQGVTDSSSARPTWAILDYQAFGDELLIGAYRDNLEGAAPTWNFAPGGNDHRFGTLFGTQTPAVGTGPFPFCGPIISVGSSP